MAPEPVNFHSHRSIEVLSRGLTDHFRTGPFAAPRHSCLLSNLRRLLHLNLHLPDGRGGCAQAPVPGHSGADSTVAPDRRGDTQNVVFASEIHLDKTFKIDYCL